MTGDSPASTLDYALDGRARRRKRIAIRVAIALVVVGGIFNLFYFWNPLSLHVRRWYWARQCLNHVTPPGTVLEERNLTRARALAASSADYLGVGMFGMQSPRPANIAVELFYGEPPPPAAYYVPEALRKYWEVSGTWRIISAVAFMGRRISPSGHSRLVIVYGSTRNAFRLTTPAPNEYEVYTTGLFSSTFVPAPPAATSYAGPVGPATLSPGVADPADASHITFPFSVGQTDDRPARTGILDVHLNDDDTLTFTIRDPATTQGL
jgi:hypothetical protein